MRSRNSNFGRPLTVAVAVSALTLMNFAEASAQMRGGGGGSFGGMRSMSSGPRMSAPTMPRVGPTPRVTPTMPRGPGPSYSSVGPRGPGPGPGYMRPEGPRYERGPRGTGPGWGAVGVGLATGVIMGIAAASANSPPPPPDDAMGPPPRGPRGSRGASAPPPPPRAVVNVSIPANGEQRFVPDEVVLEAVGNFTPQQISAMASRHRLQRLESAYFPMSNSTFFRWKITDRRPVRTVLRQLGRETLLRSAQPNYLYRIAEPQEQTQEQQASAPVQEATPPVEAAVPVQEKAAAPVQEQIVNAAPASVPAAEPPQEQAAVPVQEPAQESTSVQSVAPAPAVMPAPVQQAVATPPTFTPPEPLTPQATPVMASSGAAAAPAGDPAQYTLAKLRLNEAHNLAKGSNVLVAVIDSGIDAGHAELLGTVVGSFDALNAEEKPHSHGTAIAGAIASRSRLMGVAPSARILAIRAFGVAGTSAEATTFAILKSVEYATKSGARVINMSFAGPADPALSRHLTVARGKGIVLIAAAGNFGPKSPPQYPAADPNVIAVSATDADDKLFSASNRGNHIAVTAPGVDILLPAPEQNYQMISGTSFAAAHVSGIAALILERKPGLSPDGVRQILQSSSKDLGPRGKDDQFGAGLVDAYQAILALEPRTASGPGSAPSAAAR